MAHDRPGQPRWHVRSAELHHGTKRAHVSCRRCLPHLLGKPRRQLDWPCGHQRKSGERQPDLHPRGQCDRSGRGRWAYLLERRVQAGNLPGEHRRNESGALYRHELPERGPGLRAGGFSHATYVYWTTANGSQDGVISRARLGDPPGAPEHLVTGQRVPRGLALDAQAVYWADSYPGAPPTDGTILRANLDGTSPINLISESSAVSYVGADGVAVDALSPRPAVRLRAPARRWPADRP